jgi:hypothetical protein
MTVTSAVGVASVPEAILDLDTLDRIDYVDSYTTHVPNATDRAMHRRGLPQMLRQAVRL